MAFSCQDLAELVRGPAGFNGRAVAGGAASRYYNPALLVDAEPGRVAREVLRDLPVVRDAVEERLTDVIIDEIGHVSFNRLCLGTMGLTQARMLCPFVAAGLGDIVPELRSLGLELGANIDRPLFERSELPEQVRRHAFFA